VRCYFHTYKNCTDVYIHLLGVIYYSYLYFVNYSICCALYDWNDVRYANWGRRNKRRHVALASRTYENYYIFTRAGLYIGDGGKPICHRHWTIEMSRGKSNAPQQTQRPFLERLPHRWATFDSEGHFRANWWYIVYLSVDLSNGWHWLCGVSHINPYFRVSVQGVKQPFGTHLHHVDNPNRNRCEWTCA
jgi:hypothetical protein